MKPRESGPSRRCTMSRNRTAHLVAVLAICAAFPCSATAIAQERLFALHLTDLHIDEKISPFADPSTFCHGLVATGTQRGRFGQSYRKAAHYGHRGCDSAPALVADTFRFLSSKFGRDRVNETTRALINATLPVERLSFVLWTGDTGRHDKDPQLRREEEGGTACCLL